MPKPAKPSLIDPLFLIILTQLKPRVQNTRVQSQIVARVYNTRVESLRKDKYPDVIILSQPKPSLVDPLFGYCYCE